MVRINLEFLFLTKCPPMDLMTDIRTQSNRFFLLIVTDSLNESFSPVWTSSIDRDEPACLMHSYASVERHSADIGLI